VTVGSTAPLKLAGQEHPSRVIAFLDWIPGWRYARRYEFARVNDSNQDMARVFRHSGKLNAVFVDGHVEAIDHPIATDWMNIPWR
jgi:prepilin-type processing-associated H-X9-DG protein